MSVAELHPHQPLDPASCTNCGEAGVRRFCPACGESRPGAADLSVKHFFEHTFHEVVHLDSKIFKSFLYLVTRPGFLTLEYFAGRKTRYITPVRIYLTLFALTLIAYTVYQPVSVWDFGKMMRADTTGKIAASIDRAAAKRGITAEALSERVTNEWQKWIVRTQFVNVFTLALILQALYWFRGRYFVEHLIFSLHLASAHQLVSLLTWPVWLLTGYDPTKPNYVVVFGIMSILATLTVVAVRTYYGQSIAKSAVKGLLLYVSSYFASVVIMLGCMGLGVWSALKH